MNIVSITLVLVSKLISLHLFYDANIIIINNIAKKKAVKINFWQQIGRQKSVLFNFIHNINTFKLQMVLIANLKATYNGT